ncbi:MAG: amidohydrolase family protein [Proteobacteria bacterium]|nr:amidohydrolase family protein [Pseudomonadota bacterium]
MREKKDYTDSHIHFYEDGQVVSFERLEKIINMYLSASINTIKDMGHKKGIGIYLKFQYKDKINIQTCGYALYKEGGYGSFIGLPIKDKKEIKTIIHSLYKKGVDFIKVINSGIVTTDPRKPISNGGFSKEELKIIIEEANNLGLKVYCHVNGDKKIQEAILLGADSIEHGFFISHESLIMMKELNVEWTPTVNALLSITKFLKEEEKNYIESIVKEHLDKIYFAKGLGIKINVGSDGGSKGIKHIESFFKELEILKPS